MRHNAIARMIVMTDLEGDRTRHLPTAERRPHAKGKAGWLIRDMQREWTYNGHYAHPGRSDYELMTTPGTDLRS